MRITAAWMHYGRDASFVKARKPAGWSWRKTFHSCAWSLSGRALVCAFVSLADSPPRWFALFAQPPWTANLLAVRLRRGVCRLVLEVLGLNFHRDGSPSHGTDAAFAILNILFDHMDVQS